MPKTKHYYGLTHGVPLRQLPTWKKTHCNKNQHAFDEVWNSEKEHYLICDACGLRVDIAQIHKGKPTQSQ